MTFMSSKAMQIDKGPARNLIPRSAKKYLKMLRSKKLRRQAKKIDQPNPILNKYDGWFL